MCLCGPLISLNILYGSSRKLYSIPIVFHITGDRLSAILNSIQSGPFLPAPSIFEQAAKPPSSLVQSPFVFGQSLSQQPQPQPQLLSKSGPLFDSGVLACTVAQGFLLVFLFNISIFRKMSVFFSGLGFLLFCLFFIILAWCIFQPFFPTCPVVIFTLPGHAPSLISFASHVYLRLLILHVHYLALFNFTL